ncbi:hypothetical protein BDQ12DRAFT_627412 [Crucibulum laeve]|uniref:Uncharacterized protein n=1 Tax=Crucibulum laeve TaxID=68775 RepID=A0A5C3M5Y8_9AGAR|nr:hypothetical protein BDQ12DRAFT_627412 [Crucibulum laeve]
MSEVMPNPVPVHTIDAWRAIDLPHSAAHPSVREYPMNQTRFTHRSTGIYSLPVELLTRIFILGAGFNYPYADSPFLLKPDEEYSAAPCSDFQVLASHVCQYWRQIALLTPSLWTTIHFREHHDISKAEAFITRSSSATTYLLDILVDTVAQEEHTPGVTLYKEELDAIFRVIMPHVHRWRAFHLKICDNDCKILARKYLGGSKPAPNLETLQLYHFEDFRTAQNLYLATYRPPVIVFSNDLPVLKNVSLIGVNLPWATSPYLANLHDLELALHLDNTRPPYALWDMMLRSSPDLRKLSLHYSGPRNANGDPEMAWSTIKSRIRLESLRELSLTDLDPDYLCMIMERLVLPEVQKLSLNLPDQDFTSFIELTSGTSPTPIPMDSLSPISSTSATIPSATSEISTSSLVESLYHLPIPNIGNLQVLEITALQCDVNSWYRLLRSLSGLKILEIDFTKVPMDFWKVLSGQSLGDYVGKDDQESSNLLCDDESILSPEDAGSSNSASAAGSSEHECKQLLPNLEILRTTELPGDSFLSIINHRRSFPAQRCKMSKWLVRWDERWKGKDPVLDKLIAEGCWVSETGKKIIKVESFYKEDEEDEEEVFEEDDGEENANEEDEEDTNEGSEEE